MTIELAEKLIPFEPIFYDKTIENQTLDGIKAALLKSVTNLELIAPMKAFASQFIAQTSVGQMLKLKALHGFMFKNFPYKENQFSQQYIKDPISCFYERELGSDCKSLSSFIASICYHLGLDTSLNFIIYEVTENNNYRFIQGHVFPAVWVGGKRYVIDATHAVFDETIADNFIKNKEELICHYFHAKKFRFPY